MSGYGRSYIFPEGQKSTAVPAHQRKRECNKPGNIWHLPCIDTSANHGGIDYEVLTRRSRTFVGISENPGIGIENGIHRLNLRENITSVHELNAQNEKTLSLAADRDALKKKWELAITEVTRMVEEINIPFKAKLPYAETKVLFLRNTITNLAITLCTGLSIFLETYLRFLLRTLMNSGLVYISLIPWFCKYWITYLWS